MFTLIIFTIIIITDNVVKVTGTFHCTSNETGDLTLFYFQD